MQAAEDPHLNAAPPASFGESKVAMERAVDVDGVCYVATNTGARSTGSVVRAPTAEPVSAVFTFSLLLLPRDGQFQGAEEWYSAWGGGGAEWC